MNLMRPVRPSVASIQGVSVVTSVEFHRVADSLTDDSSADDSHHGAHNSLARADVPCVWKRAAVTGTRSGARHASHHSRRLPTPDRKLCA